MRNPRRLLLNKRMLRAHNLLTSPPPEDSLFWKMWNACTSIAQQALATDFIQGIGKGILDPTKYGAFNVSDGYYCFKGAQYYIDAESRTDNETLKAFLHNKFTSYCQYNDEITNTWHLKDASGIVPIDACRYYSDYEATITSQEDPIYTIVLMLPCEFLWYWLALQLSSSTKSNNLYAEWIKNNLNPESAYAMGNFLTQYQVDYPGAIDEDKAMQIYEVAMTYEYENFSAATLKNIT